MWSEHFETCVSSYHKKAKEETMYGHNFQIKEVQHWTPVLIMLQKKVVTHLEIEAPFSLIKLKRSKFLLLQTISWDIVERLTRKTWINSTKCSPTKLKARIFIRPSILLASKDKIQGMECLKFIWCEISKGLNRTKYTVAPNTIMGFSKLLNFCQNHVK